RLSSQWKDERKGDATQRDLVKQIRDGLNLFDLHTRQGKHAEAIKEYQKFDGSVNKLIEMHKANPEQFSPAARLQAVLLVREAMSKLAQSFAAQGLQDQLQNVLRADMRLAEWYEKVLTEDRKTGTSASAIPSRLTITASKKALDQVGTG